MRDPLLALADRLQGVDASGDAALNRQIAALIDELDRLAPGAVDAVLAEMGATR